jgi:hypothetical protein
MRTVSEILLVVDPRDQQDYCVFAVDKGAGRSVTLLGCGNEAPCCHNAESVTWV